MASASTAAIIYTSLVFTGILISSLFSLLLSYSPWGFIVIMCLYLLGCSIYTFVVLMLGRKKEDTDLRYDVASFITLFNILFAASLFIVAAFLRTKIKRNICSYN